MNLRENIRLRNKIRVFENREHAGRVLAEYLQPCNDLCPVVLAVPLGGIPVGEKIAKTLKGIFDLVPVARLPLPEEPRRGIGAVTFEGDTYINREFVRHLRLGEEVINRVVKEVRLSLKKRSGLVGPRPKAALKNKTVILVDDGLNTGYTLLAAVKLVKGLSPRDVVVAVPTASIRGIKLLALEVDKILCPNVRHGYFFSVPAAYRKWENLTESVLKPFLI
jgi:predicted phosphoribosyltransferase